MEVFDLEQTQANGDQAGDISPFPETPVAFHPRRKNEKTMNQALVAF
jgi:hypothetical protein